METRGDRVPLESFLASSLALRWLVAAVVLVAAVARLLTALADFETADEPTWMARSDAFAHAVTHGDLARASSAPDGEIATMPGIPTMWIGAAANAVWRLGWSGSDSSAFSASPAGLDLAQAGVAVVTSLLIGGLTVLLARWIGRVAALTAGLLLATEPFLVAHGAVLHTDEMRTLAAAAAFVAAALALGVPTRTPSEGSRRMGAAAGALFGLAFLSKLSALLCAPSLVGLLLWRLLGARRRGEAVRPVLRVVLWILVAFVATVVVAYPALWVDPRGELDLLVQSANLGSEGHSQFFLGEPTSAPSPVFYLVALPFRMTPWLLLASVVGMVAAGVVRRTRLHGAAIVLMVGPPVVLLSMAPKKFDRYGLVILVGAAVLVGLLVATAVDRFGRRRTGAGRWAALGAATAVVGHSLVVSPWGIAYFNPLLGGSAAAERTVLVSWGEGGEQAGDLIAEVVQGDCRGVTYTGLTNWDTARGVCGTLVELHEPADYVVVHVTFRQRWPDAVAVVVEGRELLAEKRIRGIAYLRVYGPREREGARHPEGMPGSQGGEAQAVLRYIRTASGAKTRTSPTDQARATAT